MRDKEYRHGAIAAQIEVDLPLQIRALRKQRGWTQPELAQKAEMKQPRISAMEKLGGAHFTLETLTRLAKAFDVALVVHFAPFSELLEWSDSFRPDEFSIPDFDEEFSDEDQAGASGSSWAVFGESRTAPLARKEHGDSPIIPRRPPVMEHSQSGRGVAGLVALTPGALGVVAKVSEMRAGVA